MLLLRIPALLLAGLRAFVALVSNCTVANVIAVAGLLIGTSGLIFSILSYVTIEVVDDKIDQLPPVECHAGLILSPGESCRLNGLNEQVDVSEAGLLTVTGFGPSLHSDGNVKQDLDSDRFALQIEELTEGRWHIHAAQDWRIADGAHATKCVEGLRVRPGDFCMWQSSAFRVYAIDDLIPSDYEKGLDEGRPYENGYAVLFARSVDEFVLGEDIDDQVVSVRLNGGPQFCAERESSNDEEAAPGDSWNIVYTGNGSMPGECDIDESQPVSAGSSDGFWNNWVNWGDCKAGMVLNPGEFCLWGTQPFLVFENVAGVDRVEQGRIFLRGTDVVAISEGEVEKFRAERRGSWWTVVHSDSRRD